MPDTENAIVVDFAKMSIEDGGRKLTAVVGKIGGDADAQNDVFAPGSISSGQSVVLSPYSHRAITGQAAPAGSGRIYEEDGVIVLKGEADETPEGDALLAFAKMDSMGWSLSGTTLKAGNVSGVRTIERVRFLEASPTPSPAQDGTGTVAISKEQTEEEGETDTTEGDNLPPGRSEEATEALEDDGITPAILSAIMERGRYR